MIQPQLICLIEINNCIKEKKMTKSVEIEKLPAPPPLKMYL